MTHTTVETVQESGGSLKTAIHTIDITSLDAIGNEAFDPQDEVSLDGKSIAVIGQENGQYGITHDHVTGGLHVYNLTDGTGVAAATDVGEVKLRIDGV